MTTSYLTVDDAPTETLPEKLAILEDHDVPALFFCEGRRLAEYPDHARQAVEAGYHIGNHAYSHQHASELSVDELTEEVAETETLLEEVYADAGVTRPARLFRFP
jgi:peptidoglycan/xylan/chitin deacetylase (PgdA/CDA1 family)